MGATWHIFPISFAFHPRPYPTSSTLRNVPPAWLVVYKRDRSRAPLHLHSHKMASRTLVRGLHTARAVMAEMPSTSGLTAKSLGFKTQQRQRTLPTLTVSASSREDVRGSRPNPNANAGPIDRRPRAGGDRPPRSDRPRSNQNQNQDRSQQQRSAGIDAVSAEFFEGAELARPERPQGQQRQGGQRDRRPRQQGGQGQNQQAKRRDGLGPRKERESKGRGMGSGPRNDGSTPQERGERRERRGDRRAPAAPAVVLQPVARDTSPRSLFGASALIVGPMHRARDPTTSVWAKGMDGADGESRGRPDAANPSSQGRHPPRSRRLQPPHSSEAVRQGRQAHNVDQRLGGRHEPLDLHAPPRQGRGGCQVVPRLDHCNHCIAYARL